MPKILHPNPSHHDPYPCHHSRQDDQRRVIAYDREGGVVFEFWGRVGSFSNVPGPGPDTETRTHSCYEDEPGYEENDPAPPFGFGIVPFWVEETVGLLVGFHIEWMFEVGMIREIIVFVRNPNIHGN